VRGEVDRSGQRLAVDRPDVGQRDRRDALDGVGDGRAGHAVLEARPDVARADLDVRVGVDARHAFAAGPFRIRDADGGGSTDAVHADQRLVDRLGVQLLPADGDHVLDPVDASSRPRWRLP